jgi:methylglutaconyl-CoA hydratase
MEQTAFVKTAIENGIATINFYHPQSNSLPGEILRKLAAEISSAGHDQAVKVIVIQSEGEKLFAQVRVSMN